MLINWSTGSYNFVRYQFSKQRLVGSFTEEKVSALRPFQNSGYLPLGLWPGDGLHPVRKDLAGLFGSCHLVQHIIPGQCEQSKTLRVIITHK
jgi:hypothetical protein